MFPVKETRLVIHESGGGDIHCGVYRASASRSAVERPVGVSVHGGRRRALRIAYLART